ncbi:hypothetical protein [Rhodobaculum claviforme]|uniref:Tat pathway signal sequence domain protein n=1 Tax=Rhodobaculum claviforme TaxID=1549854 RepID=A0A934TIH7_9RHOB|nr:hypothetical protein [Rhodobaculum claviforme]MBK5925842.1 hypothetical protein [Rhodobaculum claviforme]
MAVLMRGAAIVLALWPAGVAAEAPALELALDRARDVAEGCAATFVLSNRGSEALEALSLEAVIFDAAGRVARLTLFDMGGVPAEARRVREFVIPGAACDGLSAVLVNAVSACAPGTAAACATPPALVSRAGLVLE